MVPSAPSDFDDWLNLLDLSSIADPDDKIAECEYFLALASQEPDLQRFRSGEIRVQFIPHRPD